MRPGKGKKPLGLHLLHDGLPFNVLVAGICHLATRDLPRDKWAIQFHSKPFAKFPVIRQGAPDPRNRRLEFNPFLNAVSHYATSRLHNTKEGQEEQLIGCASWDVLEAVGLKLWRRGSESDSYPVLKTRSLLILQWSAKTKKTAWTGY